MKINCVINFKQHLWCYEYDYNGNRYSPVMTTATVKQLHIIT